MARPIRKDYRPRYGSEIYNALEQLVQQGTLKSGESPYLSKLFYYGMAKRRKISGVAYHYEPSEQAKQCLIVLQERRDKLVEQWAEQEFFEFF